MVCSVTVCVTGAETFYSTHYQDGEVSGRVLNQDAAYCPEHLRA